MVESNDARWWLFIHQIPPKPAYLRVKIGRRLARLGAVQIKATVYALPRTDSAAEDLQWVAREIVAGGGEATLVEARFAEGLTDAEVVRMFSDAREADYSALIDDARKTDSAMPARVELEDERRASFEGEVARLERHLAEIVAIDFFGAPSSESAAALIGAVRAKLQATSPRADKSAEARAAYAGRVWVTRAGVHIDRIASAWLIRTFIDPEALFKFVAPKGYAPAPREVRFDMFDAEFTHEGEDCTFEVLLRRFEVSEPGLSAVAEVIHDIDVKDGKFGRPETAGLAALIAGLALRCRDDEQRIAEGGAMLADLAAYYARRKTDA